MANSGEGGERFLVPVMSREAVSFLDDLAGVLANHGYVVEFVPQNSSAATAGRTESSYSDAYHSEILSHKPDKSLSELTDRYDIGSPRSLVFPQMNYDYPFSDPETVDANDSAARYTVPLAGTPHGDFEPFVEWLHQCLDYFDQLYETGDGPIPLQYQGGEIIRLALERVADSHGVPSVWAGFSPIPGHTGFFGDAAATWPTIEEAEYDELSDEEITRAEEYIEDFRERKENVRPDAIGKNSGSISGIVEQTLRQGGLTTEGHSLKNRLTRRIRRAARSKYAQWKYESRNASIEHIENQEYVFYSLQYYIESRVTVRAPAFYEQSWLIEYLSRSVPTNHELITKDHPQQLGAQPKRAVDVIARYSTALDPYLHSHDVIKNANIVVTLNNTVGYESLLYGKPVVSLGDAFYDRFTYKVKDINELDSVLAEAQREGGPSQEEMVEFVHGLFEGSEPAVWRDESIDSIENIATGIVKTAERQRN